MVAFQFDASTVAMATRTDLDFDAIRRRHSLVAVVSAVVPLKQRGHDWWGCCPFHAEKTPSFTANEAKGFYHCFGCGAHGDVLDFVQEVRGVDLLEAARMLEGGAVATIPVAMAKASESPALTNEEKQAMALAIWQSSTPVEGTPAERYLRLRGITVAMPETIRFARTTYRNGGEGPAMPCVVCAVQDADGHMTGIQRIYLQPEGQGKAMMAKPKLSLGRVAGGAIRIGEPVAGEPLLVCEGPEDGLSLHQMTGKAVWVAAGGSMLPSMRFPASVREVVVCADADDAGRIAAQKAVEAFTAHGLRVRVIYPPEPHKDWNDFLKEAR